MAMTVRDILHDADAYRRAYPGFGQQAARVPAITADSPDDLGPEGEQIAREERWS